MENGLDATSGSQSLIEHLRVEVRRRKFRHEVGGDPNDFLRAQRLLMRLQVVESRIREAKSSLDRAFNKNAVASSWPRFLRSLRRNQGAVNESLIAAVSSALEALAVLRDEHAISRSSADLESPGAQPPAPEVSR
jgi:hypothetical protein